MFRKSNLLIQPGIKTTQMGRFTGMLVTLQVPRLTLPAIS